jgi:hypothetical protein
MRKIIPYIPSIASFLIGGGLQVSGIQIPWLGYSLIALGVILLIIPSWSLIKRIFRNLLNTFSKLPRMRFKLYYEPNRENDNRKEGIILYTKPQTSDNLALVISAIKEAKTIQPISDECTTVYITERNGLNKIYPEELKTILLKLQEDRLLTLKTFPDWLLSTNPFTKEIFDKQLEAKLQPAKNNFIVMLKSDFEKLNKS